MCKMKRIRKGTSEEERRNARKKLGEGESAERQAERKKAEESQAAE